jgi:hypothetical protein
VCSQAVWAGLLSRALGERMPSRAWLGTGVCFAGVLLITGVDVSLSGDALGAGVDLHGVALPVEERPGEPYQGVVFPGQYRAEISARIVSGGGEVTCRIVVDGTVEAEMTAAGDGAVAHCSA